MHVVLDVGHGLRSDGSFDPGTTSKDRQICEHDLAMYAAGCLSNQIARVLGTAQVITGPATFNERSAQAMDADIFISLHFNAFDGSAQGSECFYHTENFSAADKVLAMSMQSSLVRHLGIKDRGVKTSDWAVLRRKPKDVPGILVEPFFLDALTMVEAYDWANKTVKAIYDVLWVCDSLFKGFKNGKA